MGNRNYRYEMERQDMLGIDPESKDKRLFNDVPDYEMIRALGLWWKPWSRFPCERKRILDHAIREREREIKLWERYDEGFAKMNAENARTQLNVLEGLKGSLTGAAE